MRTFLLLITAAALYGGLYAYALLTAIAPVIAALKVTS